MASPDKGHRTRSRLSSLVRCDTAEPSDQNRVWPPTQGVGDGSVIERLLKSRLALKQPVPFAHGADADPRRLDRRRSRLAHREHTNIPRPELDLIVGVERFPGQNVVHLGGHGY